MFELSEEIGQEVGSTGMNQIRKITENINQGIPSCFIFQSGIASMLNDYLKLLLI
jgi:hypothetical protein